MDPMESIAVPPIHKINNPRRKIISLSANSKIMSFHLPFSTFYSRCPCSSFHVFPDVRKTWVQARHRMILLSLTPLTPTEPTRSRCSTSPHLGHLMNWIIISLSLVYGRHYIRLWVDGLSRASGELRWMRRPCLCGCLRGRLQAHPGIR